MDAIAPSIDWRPCNNHAWKDISFPTGRIKGSFVLFVCDNCGAVAKGR